MWTFLLKSDRDLESDVHKQATKSSENIEKFLLNTKLLLVPPRTKNCCHFDPHVTRSSKMPFTVTWTLFTSAFELLYHHRSKFGLSSYLADPSMPNLGGNSRNTLQVSLIQILQQLTIVLGSNAQINSNYDLHNKKTFWRPFARCLHSLSMPIKNVKSKKRFDIQRRLRQQQRIKITNRANHFVFAFVIKSRIAIKFTVKTFEIREKSQNILSRFESRKKSHFTRHSNRENDRDEFRGTCWSGKFWNSISLNVFILKSRGRRETAKNLTQDESRFNEV